MAKRIKKTAPPEEIRQKRKARELSAFCEVYIPQAPQVYTYGIPDGCNLKRGSVVWVQFATRKKPTLAIVSKLVNQPLFDVRCAYPHESEYVFNERYMDALEWVSRYYISTPMKALNVFWPSDFENYLDAFAITKNENLKTEKTISTAKINAPDLTEEQKTALDALVQKLEGTGFRGALLHGVTGSGKTRVYQELAYEALKRDLKVLILVPEIGLTPQTAERFKTFLQVPVHVMHSALSAPKKRETYVSILAKNAKIVLGTRSAILAPFDFDVVILDEEHDSSFKQQDPAPRYHTRELAFHLAYKYGALVVLGSATPSLETFQNAQAKHLELLTLKNRATSAKLPQVEIIDMTKMRQQKGILMSGALRDALTECIETSGQAIILMNRRGYSKIRVCTECGETLYCKHCHVPLVYHKQHHGLLCHYCNLLYPENSNCFKCGAKTYDYAGGAIEKLEEEILEWIPNAKIERMDRDTTQNIGSIEKILEAFRNREYNILLGTQMVAKGHDFPSVSLVGIVGADSGFGIPDFRANERLFQLLSQTAGRAGRASSMGKVLIQTLNPQEPVMQFAIHHDYNKFAAFEMNERKTAMYPPFCKLVTISFGSKDEHLLEKAINDVERVCKKVTSLVIMGPVDAFIPIVQNVHWRKLYIKTQDLTPIRKLLSPIVNAPKERNKKVDVKIEIE